MPHPVLILLNPLKYLTHLSRVYSWRLTTIPQIPKVQVHASSLRRQAVNLQVYVQQNYKFPLNYLLGKNVEETIFTRGRRTKEVAEAGTERNSKALKRKGKAFFPFSKRQAVRQTAFLLETKTKTEQPFRSQRPPQNKRDPGVGPNIFLKIRTRQQKGGTVCRIQSAARMKPAEQDAWPQITSGLEASFWRMKFTISSHGTKVV